jgi:hypothetical protein
MPTKRVSQTTEPVAVEPHKTEDGHKPAIGVSKRLSTFTKQIFAQVKAQLEGEFESFLESSTIE